MKFYVYVLYSKSINSFYTGMSSNPERRLFFHNIGKSGNKKAFTKKARDWVIFFKKEFINKSEARVYENYLKGQKSKRFIKQLVKT